MSPMTRSASTRVSATQPPSDLPRPAAWPVLLAYLAAFVLTLCAGAVLVFAVGIARSRGQPGRIAEEATRFALSAPGLIAVAFVDAGVLLAVAVGTARIARRGPANISAELRLGPARASALGFIAALVGIIGLSFACGAASELLGARGGGVMDLLARQLRSPPPLRFATAILAIGVAPGVAEETFFRGLMQTRLAAAWGPWPAIVATSAAFALIHLDLVQGSVAFVAGVFLGWIADRFGSIRPTVFAHALNNGLFVVLASLASGGVATRRTDFVTLAAGAAVWVAAIAILRRGSSMRAERVHQAP
jgi:membrane protease YdiL (CAAX protease family)